MGAGATLDWVYFAAGWGAGVLGALGVLWALWWDRSRGRRRCPQCWYDMAGVPGLVCPECGRASRSERELTRTRRRKRLAGVALVALLAGVVLGSVPGYREGGGGGLVPSSLLVVMAPAEVAPSQRAQAGPAAPLLGGTPLVGGAFAPRPSARDQALAEVWRRLEAGRLAAWQSQVYLDRYFTANPREHPGTVLRLPRRWPTDWAVPVVVHGVRTGRLMVYLRGGEGEWVDATAGMASWGTVDEVRWLEGHQPAAESLTVGLRLMAGKKAAWEGSATLPITIEGTAGEFLERVDTAAAAALVLGALRPRVELAGAGPVLHFHDRSEGMVWRGIDYGVFFDAELRRGGVVIARGSGGVEWSRPVWLTEETVVLSPVAGAAAPADGALELVLRGDPLAAARAYLSRPFERPRAACWAGEVVVEVEAALTPP